MRLDQLQQEVGDALAIEWRAFLLRPREEERSVEAFTHYTERWARCAEAEPAAEFHTWSGAHAPPTRSQPSAIAGKAVRDTFGADAFGRFHLALMHAYFAENRTISDRAVILDVADACGLDGAELARRLDEQSDAYEAAVVADHRRALAQGIAAVPTVVIDHEYLLQGALRLEQYRKVVERLAGY